MDTSETEFGDAGRINFRDFPVFLRRNELRRQQHNGTERSDPTDPHDAQVSPTNTATGWVQITLRWIYSFKLLLVHNILSIRSLWFSFSKSKFSILDYKIPLVCALGNHKILKF